MKKEAANKKQITRWIYPVFLALILLGAFLYIEAKRPYFFFQDDNRDYYLPYLVHNYRSLLGGEFAFYNFYQSLGMPSFSLGQSQVFYPIAYIGVFSSNAVFGHPFAAIDIIVIIHLITGGIGMYFFVSQMTKSRIAMFLAGLTWPLCSFVVYASNSWMIISAVAAYMPWMFYFTIRCYRECSAGLGVQSVAARLLLFYSGHIQFFVYAAIFEFCFMLLLIYSEHKENSIKKEILKFVKQYIMEYIAVFLLALPLLLPMWNSTNASYERGGMLCLEKFTLLSYKPQDIMKGLFYPFTKITSEFVDKSTWMNPHNLGHIGYVPLFAVIATLYYRFVAKKQKERLSTTKYYVLAFPALFAMLWASSIVVQIFIYIIPVINRFRWPFKLGLNMDFFLVAWGCIAAGDIISRVKVKPIAKKAIVAAVFAVHIFNFILLYTIAPYKDFGEHHADEIPLYDEITEYIEDGRVVSVNFSTWKNTPNNDMEYYTVPTLGFNYCMLFGIDGFAGYEQMMPYTNYKATLERSFAGYYKPKREMKIDYFRQMGVKYYLVSKEKEWSIFAQIDEAGMDKIFEDDTRVLYYDGNAMPMVYLENAKDSILSTERTTNTLSAEVTLASDDTIIFNYINNPYFSAYIDGERAQIDSSHVLHTHVNVPAGSHSVTIKYEDPCFRWGCIISGVAIVLMLSYLAYKTRKAKSPG